MLSPGPLATREEDRALADDVRALADRADDLEFVNPVLVVGDEAPEWALRFMGTDMATLIARDSLRILRGTPAEHILSSELIRKALPQTGGLGQGGDSVLYEVTV
jgi:hypothetical protein